MEVDAFLADSVVSAEGKLYAQGAGWSTIAVSSLPARHPRIGIGIIIRVPYTATNTPHRQEIRLEDGDGHELPLAEQTPGQQGTGTPLYRVGTDFNLGRPAYLRPGDEQLVPVAVNIDGLVFAQTGNYRFVVSVDGEDSKTLGLRVHETGQGGTVLL